MTTGAPQIETFATKFGERAIACLGSGLLLLNYVGAISAALLTGGMFNTPLMVGAHAVLGACLVFQTWKLDQSEYTVDAIQGFYRFIWNLFYSVREKTASLSLSLPPAVESNTPTFTVNHGGHRHALGYPAMAGSQESHHVRGRLAHGVDISRFSDCLSQTPSHGRGRNVRRVFVALTWRREWGNAHRSTSCCRSSARERGNLHTAEPCTARVDGCNVHIGVQEPQINSCMRMALLLACVLICMIQT